MSWNESLYQYHKARGGQFLAGEADDGLLILTWKDRPLAVDLSMVTGGRSGTFSYVRAPAEGRRFFVNRAACRARVLPLPFLTRTGTRPKPSPFQGEMSAKPTEGAGSFSPQGGRRIRKAAKPPTAAQ